MSQNWCKYFFFLFFFLAVMFSSARAAEKYAGSSMELGIGARSLAIGGAAAGLFGSAEVFVYNPASLGLLKRPVIGLMHAPTFGSLKNPMANYNWAGFAMPLPGGAAVSVNWTRFVVDDIPRYPELNGESYADRYGNLSLRPDGSPTGYFRDKEDVYYFSFSKVFTANVPLGWLFIDLPVEIPFGVNLKILRQSLHTASASGTGLDLGAMFKTNVGEFLGSRSYGDMAIGFSVLDVTRTSIVWSTRQEDRGDESYLLGLSYEHHLGLKDAFLRFFWTSHKKYETRQLFGAEVDLHYLALRVGHNQGGLTAGAGIRLWRFIIDYAFVSLDFDNAHRLSTSIRL